MPVQNTILLLHHFRENNKKLLSRTDLKNLAPSRRLTFVNLNERVYFVTLVRHLTEQYTILSGKSEMSRDSATSLRNNYSFTDLAFKLCNSDEETHNADATWLESQAKELTNQSTPFISKQKQTTTCASRLAMGL